MRKDDAQIFIMKARVVAGWISPEALEEMLADMAAEQVEAEQELTEEERALMALGALGTAVGEEETAEAVEEGGADAASETE